jgi:hypothetical protein
MQPHCVPDLQHGTPKQNGHFVATQAHCPVWHWSGSVHAPQVSGLPQPSVAAPHCTPCEVQSCGAQQRPW